MVYVQSLKRKMCNYRKEYTQITIQIPASSIRHRKEYHLANRDINESLEDWYNRLRALAEACQYDSYLDAFLLHQFICGLEDSILDQLNAENRDLSFIDIIDLIRNYEQSKEPVVVKPEIKQEEIPSSDDEHYNDNSIDIGDDNDQSYEDNIQTMVPFMAETLIETQPSQSFQPPQLSQSLQFTQAPQSSQPISGIMHLFECYLCHKSWKTIGQLKHHNIQYHTTGKTAICYLCGKFIKDASNMVRHLNFHLSLKPHQCNICYFSFARSKSLKVHLLRHDSSKAGAFKCSSCEKTFISKKHLRIHQDEHNAPTVSLSEKLDKIVEKRKSIIAKSKANGNTISYRCEICSASFEDEGSRDNHMKVHCETEWLCHLCGKKLMNKRNLIHHYRVHNNEKPFKCEGCDKLFASKEKLKLHSKTHTGLRPHVCPICSKSFIQKGHLEGHIKGHSKLKCDQCGKEYVNEEKFKKHLVSHLSERSNKNTCTVCNKVFKYNSQLIEHERIHTGERPYECSICSKRFTNSSTLRGHFKRHSQPPKPRSDRPKKKRKPKAEKAITYSVLSIQPTVPYLG